MKQIISKLTFIFHLFMYFGVVAQTRQPDLQKYPARVLVDVENIGSRTNLSLIQKRDLATYLYQLDSIANIKKSRGFAISDLSQYYTITNQVLSKVLTAPQIIDYNTAKIIYNTTEFEKAVKYRDDLKLNESQINALVNEIAKQKSDNYFEVKEHKKLEFSILVKVLDKKQYDLFFTVINREKALDNSKSDWQLLQNKGLAGTMDSINFLKEDFNFQVKSLSHLDQATYSVRKFDLSKTRDSIEASKPLNILKLDIIKGFSPGSLMSYAYGAREILSLTKTQTILLIDQLALLNRDLNGQKIAPSTVAINQKKRSSDVLIKVLTPDQYARLWILSNQSQANSFAQNAWYQIRDAGLADIKDSLSIYNNIYKFKIDQLVKIDTFSVGKFSNNLDSVKGYTNLYKPEILWKLDLLTNNWYRSELTKVLRKQREYKLTSNQSDSLMNKIKALEKWRLEFTGRYPDLFFNSNAFQSEALIKILSNEQFTRYLNSKNYPLSFFKADLDWEALVKANLVNDKSDKQKINRENQEYELKFLVITDQVNAKKTRENLLAKQTIEFHKPELLKKLAEMNNENTVNKHLKSQFAW